MTRAEPAGEPRRRKHRRVIAPGTGPAGLPTPEADGERYARVLRELGMDEPDEPAAAPGSEAAGDRWLREQKPPHWG